MLSLLGCAEPDWRLTAVRWAQSEGVAVERLVPGVPGTVDMAWSFFLLEGHGRVVLIDAGSDRMAERAEAWQLREWVRPAEALAGLVDPATVTDIVLTHDHWDHAEGVRDFPGAWVWGLDDAPRWPGVELVVAGRHVPGHRVVIVRCRDREVAVAGDGVYLYANLELGRPISATKDPEANLREMKALAKRAELLPNHDPELYRRYPPRGPRAAWICR